MNIVERIGKHPDNPRQVGAWLAGDFELVHIDCHNTTLDKRIVVGAG